MANTMYVGMLASPSLTRARLALDTRRSIKQYLLLSTHFKSHAKIISEYKDISFIRYENTSTFFANYNDIGAIDGNLIDCVIRNSEHLLNLLLISQRFSPPPSSVNHSLSLVLSALQWASSLLYQYKPNNLFFPITPHNLLDYALYASAKHLNIPCRISLALSAINDDKVFAINDIYQNIASADKLQEVVFSNDIPSDLPNDIIRNTSLCLSSNYSQNQYSKTILRRRMTIRSIRNFAVRKLYLAFHFIGLKKYKVFDYSKYALPVEKFLSEMRHHVVQNKKIIFYPLQFQPEVTSVPQTRPWFTTDHTLNLISSMLPSDCILVIKEHPNLYVEPVGSVFNWRLSSSFERLAKNKNVIIAPYNINSKYLLSISSLVITGTGSIGTEALLSKIPVICLGNAPYLGLENVYGAVDYKSLSSLLSKIDKILSKDNFDLSFAQISALSRIPPSKDLSFIRSMPTDPADEDWQLPYSTSFNN